MKIHNCLQGSSEWLNLRAGLPTSSEFDRIITPSGKPSDAFDGYLYDLLAERIMGRPRKQAITLWMERGSATEAEARSFYEFQTDNVVEQVGLITNDEGTIGASPDGMVGEDGLVEIKCPSDGIHCMYLL